MKHKKLYLSLLLCVACLATACGRKQVEELGTTVQKTVTSGDTKSSSSVEKKNEAEQSDSQDKEEAVDTPATFNGSYYAVQGKYGEVMIVNKKHGLSADYGYGENPEALAAFQELLTEMQGQGFEISDAYSGFRSYDTQAELYQNYVAADGQAEADRYSARPGYSEHQTGLAFDVIDSSGNLLEEPVASQWLLDHAHQYGFVVRYLAGKEDVTGYMPEPWHLRYIGAEATDIAQSGLTLEEYYGVPGGGYTD